MKDYYVSIVVFTENTRISPLSFSILWKTSEAETKIILETLLSYSLIQQEGACYYLHGLQRSFLRGNTTEPDHHYQLIKNVLEKYGSYHNIEDEYMLNNMAYHLYEARAYSGISNFIQDVLVIEKRIQNDSNNIFALIRECKQYSNEVEFYNLLKLCAEVPFNCTNKQQGTTKRTKSSVRTVVSSPNLFFKEDQ